MNAKQDKPAQVEFSFETLNAEDVAELPKATRNGSGRSHKPTVFDGWLSDTYSLNSAKAVVVPADQRASAKSKIRAAAVALGIGARVREEELDNGTWRITFAGRARRPRKPNVKK